MAQPAKNNETVIADRKRVAPPKPRLGEAGGGLAAKARSLFLPLPRFPIAGVKSGLEDLWAYLKALPLGYPIAAGLLVVVMLIAIIASMLRGPAVRYLTSEQKLWVAAGESYGHVAVLSKNEPVVLLRSSGQYLLVVDSVGRAGWVQAEHLSEEQQDSADVVDGSPASLAPEEDPKLPEGPAAKPKKKKPKRR
jgi:hypothetical protein